MFILFPSPRYFHETRGRSLRYTLLTPLSSWRVLKTTSSPIRLSIFSRAHRHFRSHHSRLLVLRPRTFLMCPWLGLTLLSSAFPPPPPPLPRRVPTFDVLARAPDSLSFASRKRRGYYACMPGFDVAGDGAFSFSLESPVVLPRRPWMLREHFAFPFKLYNGLMFLRASGVLRNRKTLRRRRMRLFYQHHNSKMIKRVLFTKVCGISVSFALWSITLEWGCKFDDKK